MIELAQLFQDMEALVVQQEPAVMNIEQKGEEVQDNVGKANVHMDGAIQKARSRNRKKWWCLLIARKFLVQILHTVLSVLTWIPSAHYHYHCRGCCGGGRSCTQWKIGHDFLLAMCPLLVKPHEKCRILVS